MQNLRNTFKKYFSVGSKSTLIGVILCIILLLSIFNMRKQIIISIDGQEEVVTTYTNNIENLLAKNGITLEPKDKIEPSLHSKINNGDKVTIKRAVDVVITVDGKELNIKTAEDNIEAMLAAEGITTSEMDKVIPNVTEPIKQDLKVSVKRIKEEVLAEAIPIEYSTEVYKDEKMLSTNREVIQQGVIGERQRSIKVVYEDGNEISREVLSDVVSIEPVAEIIKQGTLNTFISSRGDSLVYKNVISVKTTAYCPQSDPAYNLPASGLPFLGRNPSGYSTIAVDTSIIPFGTKVYIEGYGYAIAQDTGGFIKGYRIDVFKNSLSEALAWGVRTVNVYILE